MPKILEIIIVAFIIIITVIVVFSLSYFFVPWESILSSITGEKLQSNISAENNNQVQDVVPVQDDNQTQNNITWGVDFSQFRATRLKMDWKETYSAIIDDLGVKNIKIHTNWDLIETQKEAYYFNDTDWQLKLAEENNVKIIYVLGMKTGRFPECHIPAFAANFSKEDQQQELLKYITAVVLRYKDSKVIINWQVENEPLFEFGECPSWYYDSDEFLKKEVDLVKSLDPSRKIIISDSGEQSNWLGAATIGDIVGTTMYKNHWPDGTDVYNSDPYTFLNPEIYVRKSQDIKKMFGKDVICVELQTEPWTQGPFLSSSLDKQAETMSPTMFKEAIDFAKKSQLNTFYFWGSEYWYWMKTVNNQPDIWNGAKTLFQTGGV